MKTKKALFRLVANPTGLDCVVTATFLTTLSREGFDIFGTDSILQIMQSMGNNFLKPVELDGQDTEPYDLYVVDYEDESLPAFLLTVPATSLCVDFRMLEDDDLYTDLLRLLCLDPDGLVGTTTFTVFDFSKDYREALRNFVDFTVKNWPQLKELEEKKAGLVEYGKRKRLFLSQAAFTNHLLDVAKEGKSPYLKQFWNDVNSKGYGE